MKNKNPVSSNGKSLENRVFYSSEDAINIADKENRIVLVNPAFTRLYGYEPKEIIGKSTDVLRSKDHPEIGDEILFQTMIDGWRGRVYNKRKDGTVFPIHLSTSTIRDERGASIALMAISRDITQELLLENSLLESEKRFKESTELLPAIYFETDIAFNVVYANTRGMKDFGLTPEKLAQGININTFLKPEELAAAMDNIAYVMRTGKTTSSEYTLRRLDGTEFSGMVISTSRSYGNIAAGLRGVIIDVTERKNADKERDNLVASLQEALANVKTLSSLIPICSHCRRIRDENGEYIPAGKEIESYMRKHLDAKFSHGICPDCLHEHHPETYRKKYGDGKAE